MPLTPEEVSATGDWIADVQLASGMIPWFKGGHADPWNHIEAAMALLLAGRREDSERAFEWLLASQHDDGSWCRYYLSDGVEDPRRDPNVVAYLATGGWWHYLSTADRDYLGELWPAIDSAIEFVLRVQQRGGEVLWSVDPDGRRGGYALLTSTSSIYFSLRCAIAVASALGVDRPDWELAADRMADSIVRRPESYRAKDRWAMDWYYPVLCGAIKGERARRRLDDGWSRFVIEGLGVRCVSTQNWVTAAETAECAIALNAVGMADRAEMLLECTRHMREDDGSYWTGCVHPACVRYPGGERTTYTAGAVLLANHAIHGAGLSAALFRGETLPSAPDVDAVVEPLGDG